MTGAEAIAKCLINEKVEYVFGYPGVAIAPLFDSLYGTQIHSVLIRQEQNAAHAASGYARISGWAAMFFRRRTFPVPANPLSNTAISFVTCRIFPES